MSRKYLNLVRLNGFLAYISRLIDRISNIFAPDFEAVRYPNRANRSDVAIGLALYSALLGAGAGQAQSTTPVAKTEAPITLESFAQPPLIDSPQLSPNGQLIAARISVGDTQILAMVPVFAGTGKPTYVRIDPEHNEVDGWFWVNDDWLLVSVSGTLPVEGEKWRVSRVISVNRATGKRIPLAWSGAAQTAGDVIWSARDGSPRILLGVQNSIYGNDLEFWPEVREIDVSNGKEKIAVKRRGGVSSYYADASGAVRLGYGYDASSRTARLLYRSHGQGNFRVLDRANYARDEQLAFPNLFLAAPDQALTIDASDGHDALYELDLTTLKIGRKLYGAKGYDVDRLIASPDGTRAVGVSFTTTRPMTAWLDPEMAQVQSDLDKAVGEGKALIVSWDRAMQLLLVKVGGPDQAGAYFIYDRAAGGTMKRLGNVDDRFKLKHFAPVTTIEYTARDGLAMNAVLTLPRDRPARNLPLILLPHGGPQARDAEGWDWWVQFLAWRGYAVVQPNYRGSTGFGTAFFEKGYGEWGLKMQDDLNDAVDHLAGQGMIDPKRVCIVGASYGGYAAMRGAQRDGARFRCAISYAGVSDLAALARYDRRSLMGREYANSLQKKAPDFAAVSPLRAPAQFAAPILIMHGKLDLRVPVKQSRDLASALTAAGKPFRYVEQPLGDHHFSRTADRLEFLREMDAFLTLYNPPDSPR